MRAQLYVGEQLAKSVSTLADSVSRRQGLVAAKELSQNNIVNLLLGLYRVIPFPVEFIPCDADCG